MITGSARGTGERLPQTVARAAARAPRIAVITAAESSPRVSMSLLIVGSEATAPNNSGWARMTAASARQSPPSAIVTARFSTVLPGSCTDRAGRHGLNACESSLASPLTWADSSNSAAPADEINDSPPDSTPTPPQRLGFTYGVPFSYPENGPSTSPFSLAGQALPCITRRTITPSSTQPRKIEANAPCRRRSSTPKAGQGSVSDEGVSIAVATPNSTRTANRCSILGGLGTGARKPAAPGRF